MNLAFKSKYLCVVNHPFWAVMRLVMWLGLKALVTLWLKGLLFPTSTIWVVDIFEIQTALLSILSEDSANANHKATSGLAVQSNKRVGK